MLVAFIAVLALAVLGGIWYFISLFSKQEGPRCGAT